MPPALLALVKRALADEKIPQVNACLPLLRESNFYQYPSKPLVFRYPGKSKADAAMASPLHSAADNALMTPAGPGMVMASQALLKDNMVQVSADVVEVLRVRRWMGPTASYVVETFEVLQVPPVVLQNQNLLKDGRRVMVQGTVFRALRQASRDGLAAMSLDAGTVQRRDMATLEVLFHHTVRPFVSDREDTSCLAHNDDRCSLVSFDTFSQGETVISDSMCSVLQSRSHSHMDETPVRVVTRLSPLVDEAAAAAGESNKHFLWMKSAICSYRRSYSARFEVAGGWKRWDAKCDDGLNRSLIVNSIDDVILYCGGSRKAAYAAVQFLDRFVALTTNPVETCKEISRRIDGRRANPIFPPVNELEPKLNLYFIAVIGVCCMLGCKIEDKAPPHIERLTKCLKVVLCEEAFLKLEMLIFQKLQYNLTHNSMEQTIEVLLYIFSGDDESLYAVDRNAATDKNPSAWKKFQQLCRFLGDVTLRGLSPSNSGKFDESHQTSSLDLNPLLLGTAVVAFAAKLHQVQLPEPILLLFPPEFRKGIREGTNCLPLLLSDKRYGLLQEFGRTSAHLLSSTSVSPPSRSAALLSKSPSPCLSLPLPAVQQHMDPLRNTRLIEEDPMTVALQYVQCTIDTFRPSHEACNAMRTRYPHLMKKTSSSSRSKPPRS